MNHPFITFLVAITSGFLVGQTHLGAQATKTTSSTTTAADSVLNKFFSEADNTEKILSFSSVEQKPLFQGGDINTFSKWVSSHLTYPEDAYKEDIQGRVIVQFVIDREGKVTNVKVLGRLYPSLDKEAVRVISDSPRWFPGRQDGERVEVICILPVFFNSSIKPR